MSTIVLLINKQDILQRTSLGGNVDIDKLLPHIHNAQEVELVRILGSNLYEKFIELIRSGDINDPVFEKYKELLDTYIKPALVFYTMVYFVPFHQYQLANAGISRPTGENIETISKEEVDYLVQKYRNLADAYANNLDEYICKHPVEFSEMFNVTDGKAKQPAGYNTGLYLEL